VALHEEDGGGLGLREVHEGVAQVALVLVVDGQVEEIVLAAASVEKCQSETTRQECVATISS